MNRPHMAFKCAYNDNRGDGLPVIGYMGACSKATAVYNVKKGSPWCSLPECPCSAFVLKKEPRPDNPCQDSSMLVEWRAYAGFDHNGPYSWTPRRILKAREGGLVFTTTRYPGTSEAERFIFAVFVIGKVVPYDPDKSGWVEADPLLRIALSQDEPVYFWDYYRNAVKPEHIGWGSGRFRYMDDTQASNAMRAIASTVRGEEKRTIAERMVDFTRARE